MGKSNAQIVYETLTAEGLSSGAAAGVVGNLVAESGVNPRSVQGNGPGRGIAQWSVGQRWQTLLAWARGNGRDPLQLETQEAFLIRELKGMGVWTALQNVTDPLQAAAIVMRQYEMPKNQSDANAHTRANLGINAVQGAENLQGTPTSDLQGAVSGAAGAVGNAVAGAAGAAAGAVSGALGGAAGDVAARVVASVEPVAVKVGAVVLGLALVGVGVVRASSGRRAPA